MKFILEIEDNKADILLELLNDFPYVEVTPFISDNSEVFLHTNKAAKVKPKIIH